MKKAICTLAMLALVSLAHVALAADAAAPAKSCDVNAGPIWNQQDAETKCPKTCGNGWGAWNGQWKTTQPGKMSVCGCGGNAFDYNAGPLWNQKDAEQKCPGVCTKQSGVWNGQWKTTQPGKMSVCGCLVCKAKS
jgi:hypothetical protein